VAWQHSLRTEGQLMRIDANACSSVISLNDDFITRGNAKNQLRTHSDVRSEMTIRDCAIRALVLY
jgi:hypothetical protein